ncbi:hypothetical protein NEMBOFW57_009948 [Staphylotrichum longicolle]|uniref:Uncharacterized protein n=1 Tax=Staphylotrichum longicolle TaxID=669026 RepID=A0AAD4EPY5_9PEZI|nr:hypothetical protein NEMBOFW57_009948 [Staphylotrichum longicolle]
MSTSPAPLNLDPQPQATKKPPLLPSPRTLLTNLVNAIATIPLLPATPPPPPDDGDDNGRITKTRAKESKVDNPLRRVPPSHRHLIVTLHVLFPGLVLPALDLLERGLVARVSLLDGKATGQNGRERERGNGVT